MVGYIVQIAQGIIDRMGDPTKYREVVWHSEALAEEMKKLDPRDFLPEFSYPFIVLRLDIERQAKAWTSQMSEFLNSTMKHEPSRKEIKATMESAIALLGKYGGEGWRVRTREFGFIGDEGLRLIVERDYKELTLVLFPGGAWKSTVIMAGSILEAILFDLLASDPAVREKAVTSPAAPRNKSGVVWDLEDWRLESLIAVATEIGLLPKNREKTFDQVLRDYRNFVHPKKEIRSAHPCGEGEAQLALGGVNAVCDILQSR